MQTLARGLISGHEKELRTVPCAVHLRSYVRVTVCEGVDPRVQQESLIVESEVSQFLGLYGIFVRWLDCLVQGVFRVDIRIQWSDWNKLGNRLHFARYWGCRVKEDSARSGVEWVGSDALLSEHVFRA